MDATDITRPDRALLGGHPAERLAGRWSAMFVAAISAAYAVVMVVGFASMGNLTDPLPDPYLAAAEVLILVMAPVMVVLMAAVHACAPVHLRMFGLVAFGWMLVAAFGVTVTAERTFGGITIPSELRAGWWWGTDRQTEGEFFRAEITGAR